MFQPVPPLTTLRVFATAAAAGPATEATTFTGDATLTAPLSNVNITCLSPSFTGTGTAGFDSGDATRGSNGTY
jgi:hypothetical protein